LHPRIRERDTAYFGTAACFEPDSDFVFLAKRVAANVNTVSRTVAYAPGCPGRSDLGTCARPGDVRHGQFIFPETLAGEGVFTSLQSLWRRIDLTTDLK